MVYVGCAGWAIPREGRDLFPAEGSHLERYAARLPAVEINASFYRPHREATYARWGATVPPGFRFAVKIPRTITHDRRLTDVADLLEAHREGAKLRALLTQVHARRVLTADVRALVAAMLPGTLLRTSIPEDVRAAEAPGFGQPVTVYSPGSRASKAYRNLAAEVAALFGAP